VLINNVNGSPAKYPVPDPFAAVFQPTTAEFLLVKPVPAGKVIVAPAVSEIEAMDPLPPFALNLRRGFELIGVV
jgi:hypothetical protein